MGTFKVFYFYREVVCRWCQNFLRITIFDALVFNLFSIRIKIVTFGANISHRLFISFLLALLHFVIFDVARLNFVLDLQKAAQSFMHAFLINFPLSEISCFVITLGRRLFVVLLIEIRKRLETIMVSTRNRLCFTE